MFGGKLRSWMEAVRPRKKQHRKDKPTQCNNASVSTYTSKCIEIEKLDNATCLSNIKEIDRREAVSSKNSKPQSEGAGVSNSRYSTNNLSSPESAYSTGYSTDGTSPGAPPDYLLNDPSKHNSQFNLQASILNSAQFSNLPRSRNDSSCKEVLRDANHLVRSNFNGPLTPTFQYREHGNSKIVVPQSDDGIGVSTSPSLGITSPRQRSRIRTNPWLSSSVPSPVLIKHEINKAIMPSKINRGSPRSRTFLSPVTSRRYSLSSSSCSSLSGASISIRHSRLDSASDDEDCTLNEMLGKYDESYVYEKETDILSVSDPTDCETDIDTGQEGGDEDDPFDGEMDFIDHGSYLEFEPQLDHNTGHCSYYNFDVSRKRSSRRRTTRRNGKQSSDMKRRSTSNKKIHVKQLEGNHLDGSRSAGATPLSARKAGHKRTSKLVVEDRLRKRSSSISFYSNHINTIDKRDKEADLKYKELISEAEHILQKMKTNGISPRKVLGPANKRVELLRSTECSKIDTFNKNRCSITETNITENMMLSKIPSNNIYNSSRCSPKKSHITNFLISNSPVLVRKEWQAQNELSKSHLPNRKKEERIHTKNVDTLINEKGVDATRINSTRHKRHTSKNRVINSSSDSGDEIRMRLKNSTLGCPQSEPVKRKIYFDNALKNAHKPQRKDKTVAFNLNAGKDNYIQSKSSTSTDNLRQQVLLNTIVNLKRNLEDQSACLKQVCRSSQNIYV